MSNIKPFNFFRKKEKRQTLEEILIQGSLDTTEITKEQALNIPSVSACMELICNTIASLPIVLYRESGKTIEIVEDDSRVSLLNNDTKDILNGYQFKRALIEDYFLYGSGYAYINRVRNEAKSIHYVENVHVGVNGTTDPIFKKVEILVNGLAYREWEFIKLTRKSKDGVTGTGVIKENNKALSVAYNTLLFENDLLTTGGNKKGFLRSQGRLSKESVDELKLAWNNLYKNNTENVVVLNNGLDFQEASSTSVEMQLSEHKTTNSSEICKLFLVPPNILSGEASDEEYSNWIKICILPILNAFESALNKDFLLPSEKESFYFAFDTNDLQKGDIEKRFKAYELGTKNGILQIDEVRYKENLPPLGLKFIKLGLQDVLYNPETQEIYTPNTNKSTNMDDPTKTIEKGEPNNEQTEKLSTSDSL